MGRLIVAGEIKTPNLIDTLVFAYASSEHDFIILNVQSRYCVLSVLIGSLNLGDQLVLELPYMKTDCVVLQIEKNSFE